MAEVIGLRPDQRAPFRHRIAKADALKLPHAVRRDVDAGADFAERGRLFVDRNAEALRQQRVGGEQAADTAADDGDVRLALRHGHTFNFGTMGAAMDLPSDFNRSNSGVSRSRHGGLSMAGLIPRCTLRHFVTRSKIDRCGGPSRNLAACRSVLALTCRREAEQERRMNGLIYLIGLIVVIMAILSFLGLR